ncbi:Hypothetical protein R9X50_00116200 [Acrodontium crateriforme]|uniref:EamA domain-containing protein n=1 Tax=Acrodontium crateriforme TaxID=150365 RepID=A0AAQ3M1J4_9PEZI|nr:Hypothetical protein R9X50_00116200 [Acrodontium crateriforme]
MSAGASGREYAEPLLNDERNSLDIELSQLDGGERTPTIHYANAKSHSRERKSPLLIAATLALTVIGFTINTEATAYFEDILGYQKPFAILYVTHSSLALPWLCHLAYLRYQARHVAYGVWAKQYNNDLRASISTIEAYVTSAPRMVFKARGQQGGPLDFLATTMALVTLVLTISGCSWFFSLSLTTPADLTAIYNCSTFFAAVFSIPILHEKLGGYSMIAVALSIAGTFIVAYADTTAEHVDDGSTASHVGSNPLLGNLIACVGAVAFGLYEVLFKKWACPTSSPRGQSALPLTLAASALTGIFTFCTLWIGLVALHIFGFEVFEWPSAQVAMWIVISVLTGSFAITSLVLLVIWTDPIFGSMANVLAVFAVAVADWFFWDKVPPAATYIGGIIIVLGFGLLAWDTFREAHHH